jgi:uncharacterized protein YndB with AHSA1/START domain
MGKNHLEVNRNQLSLTMSRVFDAPPEQVWRVYTDPAYLRRWWGLRENQTVIEKHDLRPGGEWRYVEVGPDGQKSVFYGTFQTVEPPITLVYTFEYEPWAGHVSTDHLTFEPVAGGKTRIVSRTTFNSLEDMEGMIQSGMESGATESWDKLEELLVDVYAER